MVASPFPSQDGICLSLRLPLTMGRGVTWSHVRILLISASGGWSNSWVNPAQVCFVESCFWAWEWNLLLKSAAKEFKIYLWRDMDSFQSIFVVLWNSLRLALCLTRVVLDKFLYFWINHNFLVILPVRSHIFKKSLHTA